MLILSRPVVRRRPLNSDNRKGLALRQDRFARPGAARLNERSEKRLGAVVV